MSTSSLAPSPLDLVPAVRKDKCEDSESPPVLYGGSAPVESPPGLRQRRAGGAGQELEELREEGKGATSTANGGVCT